MSKYRVSSIETVCSTIQSYFPDANLDTVRKAYDFAVEAHRGQLRSSGDPYIIHPVEVAQNLADLRLDLASIITGLLHDTVEDTPATLEQIEKLFGKDVSELVDGVTKLSKMQFKTSEEKQAENFRKMIMAMAKDIRVIIVKLADRLNNMQTLEHLIPAKQRLIAQETLEIYAPIANRLGMGWIKVELEDLCLRYLHPDVYYKLAQRVSKRKGERESYIEEVCGILGEKLKEYDVTAQISGRAKHFYSIYKKMERREIDFDQVFDVIAFRIVVDNITECYKSLGVIHATYMPVPGRFKDYIAIPKANGYQSLHTSVMGPQGERIEIQIRTQDMNMVAEKGIAAHWKYKEGRFDNRAKENVEWVNRLLEWHKDLKDPNEFLETVKIDLFGEDVFIFTPKGEVRELSHGATPLDFAYAVHTDVGHHCVGAKVNGKIVSLRHRLKSGDSVEVITSPTQFPSKDWLKIVKTSRAKAKIRAFIKIQERQKALTIGKEILDKALKEFDTSVARIEKNGDIMKAAHAFSLKSSAEIYIAVGYGRFTIDSLLPHLIPKELLDKKLKAEKVEEQESFLKKVITGAKKRTEGRTAITVGDVDDVLIRFARCCSPLPGDSIVGFITRGRGVTIHQANCEKANDQDNERKVSVEWNEKSLAQSMRRAVKIGILSLDEPGLLATMTQAISGLGVNISSANVRTTKDKKAVIQFDLEVNNLDQLNKVLSALEGKKGVISVERVRS